MPTLKKVDYKVKLSHLYKAGGQVAEVEVPTFRYLMVDGSGDPNISPEYKAAVEALYALAYAIRFKIKRSPQGVDYGVMPLEGLWWTREGSEFSIERKGELSWTAMIMQPEPVSDAVVAEARAEVAAKKNPPALARVRFAELAEGQAAQLLHLGPYSEEAENIARLHDHIRSRGGRFTGRHHEIYLSDPSRTAPERLKTIIRQPFTTS